MQRVFGEAAEKRLKLDGQLGYLTLNNAPLIRAARCRGAERPERPRVELARHGYYRAEKWQELMDGTDSP